LPEKPVPGSVGWFDLTVPDASAVRDFYKEVVGWAASEVPMGGYDDFCMHPAAEGVPPVAGVCHARGGNANLPPVWLIYINVADLDASLAACAAGGGAVVSGPRSLGGAGRMAVIRDPAGAVSALYEPAADPSPGAG